MASRRRHQDSLLHLLLRSPWWVSLVLAALCYAALRYGPPQLTFDSILVKSFANALPSLAWMPAAALTLVAFGSAMQAWSRGELFANQTSLADIKRLSWQDFERFVGEFYRRQGYRVQESGGGGSDGGVDLVLKKNGETIYVQCKRWRNRRVGIKPTKELFATVVAENAAKGVLMTTAGFTRDAETFAASQPKLELVDGPQLVRLMNEGMK